MFMAQHASSGDYLALIAQTFGVLALIAALAWVLVRFVAPRLRLHGGKARMRVLDHLTLEPRRSLYMVRVDDEDLLIGVSDGSVNLLKTVDNKEDQ